MEFLWQWIEFLQVQYCWSTYGNSNQNDFSISSSSKRLINQIGTLSFASDMKVSSANTGAVSSVSFTGRVFVYTENIWYCFLDYGVLPTIVNIRIIRVKFIFTRNTEFVFIKWLDKISVSINKIMHQ